MASMSPIDGRTLGATDEVHKLAEHLKLQGLALMSSPEGHQFCRLGLQRQLDGVEFLKLVLEPTDLVVQDFDLLDPPFVKLYLLSNQLLNLELLLIYDFLVFALL